MPYLTAWGLSLCGALGYLVQSSNISRSLLLFEMLQSVERKAFVFLHIKGHFKVFVQ